MSSHSSTPRLLAVLTLSAVSSALLFLGVTAVAGADTEGLRATLRVSGRVSFVLFLLPLVASSVARLWPAPATRLLVRRRRELGLVFAGSHIAHLGWIVWLAAATRHHFPAFVILIGGLGLVLVGAMAVTSFKGPARWLGTRRWKLLHSVGVHYIVVIFAYDFFGGVLRAPLVYAPFAALLVAAMSVRVVAKQRQRSPSRSPSIDRRASPTATLEGA